MFYGLKVLFAPVEIENHEQDYFLIFNSRIIKGLIKLFRKLNFYSFLDKIPRSFLKFISTGVSYAVTLDKNYYLQVYKNINDLMGPTIVKKYGKERKDYIIKRLIYHNFIQMSLMFFDILFLLPHLNIYKDINKYFKFKGIHYLKKALKKGKGVVIVSAHTHNFLFLSVALALSGYKVNLLMETQSYYGILDEMLKSGMNIITTPTKSIIKNENIRRKLKNKLNKILQNNEILIILQDFGREHYSLMHFFGNLCYTPIGAISLSLKHGSPIIPTFIKSNSNKHLFEINFEPPFELIKENLPNDRELILFNAYRLNKYIERYIKRNFIHWHLLHAYHERKIYSIDINYRYKSLIDMILDRIEFFKELIMKSYEPGRDDEKIIGILDDVSLKIRELNKNKKN